MLDMLLGWGPLRDVRELMAAGGPVVVWIFVACVILWAMIAERYWYFFMVLPRRMQDLQYQWQQRTDHHSWFARMIRTAMISRLRVEMGAGMPVLRVLVPLCPLLGLLGTVGGMLEVFDAMAIRGTADARTMASGISQAMVCTMMGLAVSISGLFPIYQFQSRIRRLTELAADRLTY
jgi:biopolymer transport protein ExbB